MPKKLSEKALFQCAYAIGAGAKMPIEFEAINELHDIVKRGFEGKLDKVGGNWKKYDTFILGCCTDIGVEAARLADERFSDIIERDDLKTAYNDVSKANTPPPGNSSALEDLGNFCPEW